MRGASSAVRSAPLRPFRRMLRRLVPPDATIAQSVV